MSRFRVTRLTVNELNDRIVPSATLLDLTTTGASATANGAIVQQIDAQPTGTGFIHSFLRIQGAASGGGLEQGYNTTARPLQFDENPSPAFTRELHLSDVPVVTVDGVDYREFLLDINQKSSSPKLSLDEVRLFLGNVSNLTGYDPATHTLAGITASYDLDAAGDVSVILNARLNSGSGSGDMSLLIPDSAVAGADPASFVYLYSKMGAQAGATANSGFEEWAVKSSGTTSGGGNNGGGGTAGGGGSSLSGRVFLDVEQNGVFAGPDFGFGGIVMTLQGVNDHGQTVVLTTTTAADGTYSFTGLRAGTYTIIQSTQPDGVIDGADYAGSLGGVEPVNDQISQIVVGANDNGINYNFTEYFNGNT